MSGGQKFRAQGSFKKGHQPPGGNIIFSCPFFGPVLGPFWAYLGSPGGGELIYVTAGGWWPGVIRRRSYVSHATRNCRQHPWWHGSSDVEKIRSDCQGGLPQNCFNIFLPPQTDQIWLFWAPGPSKSDSSYPKT